MNDDPQPKPDAKKYQPWRVYLPQLAAHLWLGICALWPLWFTIVVCRIIVISGCGEREIRLLGMLLQFGGFAFVAKLLRDVARQGKEKLTFWGRVALYWKSFPRRGIMTQSSSGRITARVNITGRGRAVVAPGPDTPLVKRVEILEETTENLFNEVGDLEGKSRARSEELKIKIAEEVTLRKEGHKAIEKKLEEAIVGGISLEFAALIFFIAGVLLASASPEFAGWIGNSESCS